MAKPGGSKTGALARLLDALEQWLSDPVNLEDLCNALRRADDHIAQQRREMRRANQRFKRFLDELEARTG